MNFGDRSAGSVIKGEAGEAFVDFVDKLIRVVDKVEKVRDVGKVRLDIVDVNVLVESVGKFDSLPKLSVLGGRVLRLVSDYGTGVDETIFEITELVETILSGGVSCPEQVKLCDEVVVIESVRAKLGVGIVVVGGEPEGDRDMVSNVCTPIFDGGDGVNEAVVKMIFVKRAFTVRSYCVGGRRKNRSLRSDINELEEAEVVVNSVYPGGGEAGASSVAIPGVVVLGDFLEVERVEHGLKKARGRGGLVSLRATAITRQIGMIEVTQDKRVVVVASREKGANLRAPFGFV